MQRGGGRKRPLPPSSGGGADLLDSILGGMTKTMRQLPVRPPNYRGPGSGHEEGLEIASHYGMVRPAQGAGTVVDKLACRNPECGGREFDTDWRQGDRICRRCGAVQNHRSVESHEEEHRTFADDEKKESKQRTSQVTARGGGAVGQANLQRVAKLADDAGDGEDGISEKDLNRINKYKEKVADLANKLELTGNIVREGQELCKRFVANQIAHDEGCGRPGNCRLGFKNRSHALVAAAVLKEAMRKHDTDRTPPRRSNARSAARAAAALARMAAPHVLAVARRFARA